MDKLFLNQMLNQSYLIFIFSFILFARGLNAQPRPEGDTISNTVVSETYYISPSGDDRNPGTIDQPWKTISKANKMLKAGDTVFLRGGNYNGQTIEPVNSGTGNSIRITYAAYPGEQPVIRRVQLGMKLIRKNYITIDSIDMDGEVVRGVYEGRWPGVDGGSSNIQTFALMEYSGYNIIRNVVWQKAHGWSGVNIKNESHHNKILDSVFDFVGCYDNGLSDDKGDVLQIQAGTEHNLVEGNVFKHGGHNLIEMTGRYNVVRNNVFNNDWSDVVFGANKGNRALSYKGEGPIDNTGGFNLFEDNIVINAKAASDNPNTPSMKVIGENQIARRNFYYNNLDVGVLTANGSGASNGYLWDNKIYHNVLVNNGGAAWKVIWSDKSGKSMDNNMFKNNIVYRNNLDPKNSSQAGEIEFARAKTPSLRNNKVFSNLIYRNSAGEVTVYAQEDGMQSLSWYESNYPENFSGNIEQNPQFVTTVFTGKPDFRLRESSPAIDAGAFLTQTKGSGSGKTIIVDDAGYFTDGFDIVPGDLVQLEGQTQTARITHIDYKKNTLTVDTSLSWEDQQGLSLNYTGSAPDIGAYEYDSPTFSEHQTQ